MLFSNLIFHFPIWCTDPATIVKFQTEHFVGVQQSVTLNCEAEGNPPPTYTWTPCDQKQVCNKRTLHISQVLNDANYTCRVANVYGDDSKTASVCKSYVHCSHASNSCQSSYIYQNDILIGFLEFNQGFTVSLPGYKNSNSAFTLSWWITLWFLYMITMYMLYIDYVITITCKMQRNPCSN